jgi:DNA-directed RNA polymerase specialized sigma24 family protein
VNGAWLYLREWQYLQEWIARRRKSRTRGSRVWFRQHSAINSCDWRQSNEVVRFSADFERVLGRLKDGVLKTIALRKLEGYGVQEIASELDASTRTIERKLRLIRAIWEEEAR